MTTPEIILWVYIVLLMLGGLMGFIKAGSKASLIASTIFSAVLVLFALNISVFRFHYHWIVLLFLLVFFAMRYGKNKKFMPNGLMTIVTLLALLAPYIIGALNR